MQVLALQHHGSTGAGSKPDSFRSCFFIFFPQLHAVSVSDWKRENKIDPSCEHMLTNFEEMEGTSTRFHLRFFF
jgi:hypothetical protein